MFFHVNSVMNIGRLIIDNSGHEHSNLAYCTGLSTSRHPMIVEVLRDNSNQTELMHCSKNSLYNTFNGNLKLIVNVD
ncbi:CLUMA_CG002742, isoform A [Clunio marinus]|uniref:CLUMA_CG002742, isoform A n=1 Tax=Clunio marinus TaxID=568069 RepID=A0A1J1HM06_9DIPT|nr:CLUMA_CG002742, isoform A [Clunio marinus]